MMILQHKFVEHVPDKMESGVLYVSIAYCTVMHLCVCGCGNEVVTPISPANWQLNFDGKSISLSPSIGNWNFDCRSHYWIVRNEVRHAKKWSNEKIDRGIADERRRENFYYMNQETPEKPHVVKTKRKKSTFELFRSFFNF